MRPLINKHENILVWVSISFCLSVWLYGLNRNLNLPFIGDSLGYVSRAKNISMLGVMNHAPIEPFGVPIQSLGYSSLLSVIPYQILSLDSQLRSVVAIVQITIYLLSSFALSKSFAKYANSDWKRLFIGLAFFWPGALIATEVMADSIALSLHLVLLALCIRFFTSSRKLSLAALVGIVLGLSIIVRPNSIVSALVVPIAVILSDKQSLVSIKKIFRIVVIGFLVLVITSPQLIWTYQQFNQLGLIKLDNSFTGGVPVTVLEQNARATFIQLNGCMPPVDCGLINRYPGPLSWKSYVVTGSDFPTWNEWVKAEPTSALLQAGLILLASIDQEFYFTYVQYPHQESNRVVLFTLIFLMIIGIRQIFRDMKSDSEAKLNVARLILAVIGPILVFQYLMFHAENRYGLVPAALLYSFAFTSLTTKKFLTKPKFSAILIAIIAIIISQLSWSIFVEPLT